MAEHLRHKYQAEIGRMATIAAEMYRVANWEWSGAGDSKFVPTAAHIALVIDDLIRIRSEWGETGSSSTGGIHVDSYVDEDDEFEPHKRYVSIGIELGALELPAHEMREPSAQEQTVSA